MCVCVCVCVYPSQMRQIVKSQDEKFYLEDYEQKKTLINTRTLTERMRRQALGAGDVMEDNRS